MRHPAVILAATVAAMLRGGNRGGVDFRPFPERIETAAKNNDLAELAELAEDLHAFARDIDPNRYPEYKL